MTTMLNKQNVLGCAPTIDELGGRSIYERFIFEYEYFLKTILNADEMDKPIDVVLEQLSKSYPNFEQMELGQQWWVLYLSVVHLYAKNIKREFLAELLRQKLLMNGNKTEEEWQDVAESIFSVLRKSSLALPIARTSVLVNRKCDVIESDAFAHYLFNKLDEIEKFFKANVRIKDLNDEFFKSFTLNDNTIIKKYTTNWMILAESYTRFFLTYLSDYVIDGAFDEKDNEKLDEKLLHIFFEITEKFFECMTTYEPEKNGKLTEKLLRKLELIE